MGASFVWNPASQASGDDVRFGGVIFFFVISGFLITSQLRRERDQTGTLQLTSFFLRRMFRLFPALLLMTGVVSVLGALGIVSVSRATSFTL